MKTIETWLPVFPGYYSTIFEPYECEDDDLPEFIRDKAEPKYYYDDYYEEMTRACVNGVESLLSDFVVSIHLQRLVSPREYNFANDSINVTIVPKTKVIRDYLNANRDKFAEYLKERYTSCSGFISSYDNTVNGWSEYTNGFTDYSGNAHYLGAILQFIASNEGITDEMLYYACDHVSGCILPDYSEYDPQIEAVRTFARENYQTLKGDEMPAQFEDDNEFIDVPAIIANEVAKIESHTLKLNLK